jgi:hypothetical protein
VAAILHACKHSNPSVLDHVQKLLDSPASVEKVFDAQSSTFLRGYFLYVLNLYERLRFKVQGQPNRSSSCSFTYFASIFLTFIVPSFINNPEIELGKVVSLLCSST